MRYHNVTTKGITLIETLLYVSLIGVIVGALAVFLSVSLDDREKQQAVLEVEDQARLALGYIAQTVRNAESITSPTAGSTGSSLEIDVVLLADDPTIFDVSGTTLQVTEGGGGADSLTNDRVEVVEFIAENLSYTGEPDTVHVTLTLQHINTEGRNIFEYSGTFSTTATVRSE